MEDIIQMFPHYRSAKGSVIVSNDAPEVKGYYNDCDDMRILR